MIGIPCSKILVDPATKMTQALKTMMLSIVFIMIICPSSRANVQIIKGPTPIQAGEAIGANDLTLRNKNIAVSFGVDTPGPWGVPSGGILDGAVIRNGKYEMDHIALIDFIPNNWSSWPNTFQKIKVVKNSPEEGIIRVTRDWEKCTIETLYVLKKGDRRIKATTTLTNNGSKAYNDLFSGYVIWPEGGFIFQPPGMEGIKKGYAKNKALSDWVVHYDRNWAIGLHAPYFDFINYNARDMYVGHSLKVGAKKQFTGWVEIQPTGDISGLLKFESKRKGLKTGTLSGRVTTKDGKVMKDPVIIVEKDGHPYTWTMGTNGSYNINLPVGKYVAYASGKSYASSSKSKITIKAGKKISRNFTDVKYPGEVTFNVVEKAKNKPIDARISIEKGETPLVQFLGQKTFFTELNKVGKVVLPLGPGKYVFKVASGESFLSTPEKVSVSVKSGVKSSVKVKIDIKTNPTEKNWYSADMHHHSDLVDGVTAPEYLVRSQLAAKLNFTLVSDHDLVDRHYEVMKLTKTRGFEFIPSIELSPDWSHFGASPINLGQKLTVNPGTASIDELFAEARNMGALSITANHPYMPYGIFYALDNGKVPGGFNPKFDLVELNAAGYIEKTIARMHDLWAKGQTYYLSAGTDVHDVWKDVSGRIRSFAHIDGKATPRKFVKALIAGHAYASQGPLLYPEVMFGKTLKVRTNEKITVKFKAQAVNGLKQVLLMSGNKIVDSVKLTGKQVTKDFSMSFKTAKDTYYALIVIDQKNLKAWSNPVWVDVVTYNKTPGNIAKIKK
ncbi:MAG: CehA/McbA family metallohydrolase [Desulfobacterales bacterium]|nr:CehA/McbA family metallohydrolase [Desulfobacterales bacterium]MCP4160747.1 CehA/McbA family metallohydrolase [Deltaproteobacteria bacterium]